MTLCVKLLGQATPVGQTIFARGLISVMVLAFIAWHTKRLHLLKTRNWRGHAMRSLSGTASVFCLFSAVTMIPLADVTAIAFTGPLFLTVLAMIFLGERIHRYRWTALILGFAGVQIMIGPQLSISSGNSLGSLVALGAAFFAAIAMASLRAMSGEGHERRRARHHDHVLFFAPGHRVRGAHGGRGLADTHGDAAPVHRARGALRRVRPAADDLLL
jgi:drug/metabolite transporter (DMT)-like permease